MATITTVALSMVDSAKCNRCNCGHVCRRIFIKKCLADRSQNMVESVTKLNYLKLYLCIFFFFFFLYLQHSRCCDVPKLDVWENFANWKLYHIMPLCPCLLTDFYKKAMLIDLNEIYRTAQTGTSYLFQFPRYIPPNWAKSPFFATFTPLMLCHHETNTFSNANYD